MKYELIYRNGPAVNSPENLKLKPLSPLSRIFIYKKGAGDMRLYCKTCGVAVTNELVELTDTSGLDPDTWGKDYLPKGVYAHWDTIFTHVSSNEIIVNNHDVINCNYHTNQSRLNGCCGKDGCDGPNRVCVNGHEVGTERSDCWTYHYTSFNPEVVEMAD